MAKLEPGEGRREPVDDGILDRAYLDRLLPYLAEAVCLYDNDGLLKARIGPPGGILGHGMAVGSSVFSHIHPDDLPTGIQIATAMRESEPGWEGSFSVRLEHSEDGFRPYQIRVYNRMDRPELGGFLVCIRESFDSDGQSMVEELAFEPVTSMADAIPTASLLLDGLGRVRHASAAATSLLGRNEDELLDIEFAKLAVDHEAWALRAAIATLIREPGDQMVVFRYPRAEAELVLEAAIHVRKSSSSTALIAVVLTDRTAEPELVRLATRDALTGLANRSQVTSTLRGLLATAYPQLAVLFCDLDHFKAVNDIYGHDVGDRALVEVADQLRALVRPGDLVGRMGGDEFVIVCPGLSGPDAEHLALRLRQDVRFEVDGRSACVRLSVGAAAASPGDTAEEVLRRADSRMFAAKRSASQPSAPT